MTCVHARGWLVHVHFFYCIAAVCASQGAGSAQGSDSINRDVKADTPEATRLVFGGSDYGKDQRSITRSDEKQAEIEELAARVGAGTAASAAAPIHHDR